MWQGPMDEMRQLVRILVKIIPHSIAHISTGDEAGGGNRISEEQIKVYLQCTLGEAPHPRWGVPEGWGAYLASEPFSGDDDAIGTRVCQNGRTCCCLAALSATSQCRRQPRRRAT
jgi:hypothetical protein